MDGSSGSPRVLGSRVLTARAPEKVAPRPVQGTWLSAVVASGDYREQHGARGGLCRCARGAWHGNRAAWRPLGKARPRVGAGWCSLHTRPGILAPALRSAHQQERKPCRAGWGSWRRACLSPHSSAESRCPAHGSSPNHPCPTVSLLCVGFKVGQSREAQTRAWGLASGPSPAAFQVGNSGCGLLLALVSPSVKWGQRSGHAFGCL